jgi:hypothetical protein
LIFHVTTVDSCVSRFFSFTQNKAEIAMWDQLPSQPGFGICKPHIERLLASMRTKHPVKRIANDVEAFDWSCQYEDFALEADARISLIDDLPNGGCSQQMQNLIRNAYHCMRDKLVIFEDGTFAVLEGCIWPSGGYNTSSTNSRRRTVMGHFNYAMDMCKRRNITPEVYFANALPFDSPLTGEEYAFPSIKANGDDALELTQEVSIDATKWYEMIGARVKEEHSFDGDSFSFCSTMIFEDKNYYSTNLVKSLVKWLDGTMSDEQTRAMREMIEGHPDPQFLEIFERAVGLRNGESEDHSHPTGDTEEKQSSGSTLHSETTREGDTGQAETIAETQT